MSSSDIIRRSRVKMQLATIDGAPFVRYTMTRQEKEKTASRSSLKKESGVTLFIRLVKQEFFRYDCPFTFWL